MSSTITNLSGHITDGLTKIFGTNPSEEIKASDPRVKLFTNFLDGIIRDGYNNGESDVKASAGEVLRSVETSMKENVNLSQALTKALQDRKDAHLSGAKQHISNELLAHLGAVNSVADTLGSIAQTPKSAEPNFAQAEVSEVENVFFEGLKNIYASVKNLSADERKEAFESKVESLAEQVHHNYGSEALEGLASRMKDSSAVAFTYAKSSSHGLKELPQIIDPESLGEGDKAKFDTLIEGFSKGDYSALSADEKTKVLDLISTISQDEGKTNLDTDLKKSQLSLKENAYYEHLRNEAAEISKHGSSPMDLVSKLADKIPDLIMPAIIGAVVGYLMGGMEVVGVLGAGALSLLGGHAENVLENDSEGQKVKIAPPKFEEKNI